MEDVHISTKTAAYARIPLCGGPSIVAFPLEDYRDKNIQFNPGYQWCQDCIELIPIYELCK